MSTVKDIETKYDDGTGSSGKFYADELNLISSTLKSFINDTDIYDDYNEKAVYYAIINKLNKESTTQDNDNKNIFYINDVNVVKSDMENIILSIIPKENNDDKVTIKLGDDDYELVNESLESLKADDLHAGIEYKIRYNSDIDKFVLIPGLTSTKIILNTISDNQVIKNINEDTSLDDSNLIIYVSTKDNKVTLTLPDELSKGNTIIIIDKDHTFDTNSLYIKTSNDNLIMGEDDDIEINKKNFNFSLSLNENDWYIR